MPIMNPREVMQITNTVMYFIRTIPWYPVSKNHIGACQNDHIKLTTKELLTIPIFFSISGNKYPLQPDSSPAGPCIRVKKRADIMVENDKSSKFMIVTFLCIEIM